MAGIPGLPHGPSRGSLDRLAPAGLVALAVVAVVLRAVLAARSPAWFVEICVLRMSERPFGAMLATAAADIHPPLQFVLRWAWASLCGPGEAPQKALSILFATLMLLPAFALARRAFGPRVALLACALLALHPLLVRYGQEIEDNALIPLLVLWMIHHALAWLEERRARDLVLYALAATLAVYGEYLILPHVALVAVIGSVLLARDRRALARWLAANAAVLLLFAPQWPTLHAQYVREGSGSFFHFPRVPQVLGLARAFGFGSYRGAAVLALLAALALWRSPARRATGLLLALGTLPLLAMKLWVAILPRDVLYLLPPWLLLTSAGAACVPGRWGRRGAAAVVLASALIGLRHVPIEGEIGAASAALARVRAVARPGDVVVHAETHSLQFFAWHAPAVTSRLLLAPGQSRVPYFEGGLVIPDSLLWTSAQWDSARAAGARLWCVRIDRAYVTRGVASRAGLAADSSFRAAGAESLWAHAPAVLRRVNAAR